MEPPAPHFPNDPRSNVSCKGKLVDFFPKKVEIFVILTKAKHCALCFGSLFMHVIPSLFIIQSSIVLEEEGLRVFCYLELLIMGLCCR
jgi:hypothetical protein